MLEKLPSVNNMLVRIVLECDEGLKNDLTIIKTERLLVINRFYEYN